jgi:hypothetical protein
MGASKFQRPKTSLARLAKANDVLTFACMVCMVTAGGGTPSLARKLRSPQRTEGAPWVRGTEGGGGLVAPICQKARVQGHVGGAKL